MFSFVVVAVAIAPIVAGVYAYLVYPAILWLIARVTAKKESLIEPSAWPAVTVTVPVYNAVSSIRATLDRLIALDYPRDRLQLLVLSDASTDGTDDIVREFVPMGVELSRADERRGKTAAENAAVSLARGDIIVNVDATVIVPPDSLKLLVRAFSDPSVGVASGRDVSVDPAGNGRANAEGGYTGYEMWVRDLETRAGSIVGASGCFFGVRRNIHKDPLPPELSWDFASALVAKSLGYRSVSVPEAVCIVPRTPAIRTELRRKSRTMARGLSTLFYFRELMNPFRYGGFALMLISHKLLRWLPYLLTPPALLALGLLASQSKVAALAMGLVLVGLTAGAGAIWYPGSIRWKPLTLAGFAVAAFNAGFLAWVDALRGQRMITWNPTPRATASPA
jgi:cellulose synthase/poly-beta-1,6-N-acetylglucosamine synthase-like glycosyltransferase